MNKSILDFTKLSMTDEILEEKLEYIALALTLKNQLNINILNEDGYSYVLDLNKKINEFDYSSNNTLDNIKILKKEIKELENYLSSPIYDFGLLSNDYYELVKEYESPIDILKTSILKEEDYSLYSLKIDSYFLFKYLTAEAKSLEEKENRTLKLHK